MTNLEWGLTEAPDPAGAGYILEATKRNIRLLTVNGVPLADAILAVVHGYESGMDLSDDPDEQMFCDAVRTLAGRDSDE
jgi:hypothetical protein